jgi:hypothetical protein
MAPFYHYINFILIDISENKNFREESKENGKKNQYT